MRLTRRDVMAILAATFATILMFTWATRDVCWTGSEYGSCQEIR